MRSGHVRKCAIGCEGEGRGKWRMEGIEQVDSIAKKHGVELSNRRMHEFGLGFPVVT